MNVHRKGHDHEGQSLRDTEQRRGEEQTKKTAKLNYTAASTDTQTKKNNSAQAIRVFAGHISVIVSFVMRWLILKVVYKITGGSHNNRK